MGYLEMAEELSMLHFSYTKAFNNLKNIFTRGEAGVLLCLYHNNDALPAGEFVEKLGLTSGRIANILKNLEKKGYIFRENGIEDKRKVIVNITDDGREYISNLYKKSVKLHVSFLEALGESDAAEYIRIIRRTLEILDKIGEVAYLE